MLPKLGIIAGCDDLPKEISKIYGKCGGSCVAVTLDPMIKLDCEYKYFPIGSVGGVINYFKDNQVENIVIAGRVTRPDFKSLKVDFGGSILLGKILKQKILGDDNLLRIVIDYLEQKGFKIISSQDLLKLSEYNINISSKTALTKKDLADVEIGRKVSKALGNLDVGQSVIVANGYVIAIEGAEGTDNLIKRSSELKKNGDGILVKMSKSAQDMRVDAPVIGPQTISLLAEHRFRGIAVERSGVIVINPEKTQKLLDEYNLFFKLID